MHDRVTRQIDALIAEAMHEGADDGFKACFILEPGHRVSTVGLSNLDRMKIEDLTDAILDLVLTACSG